VLTFFVVVAKPNILMFSSAELFMFAILGLSVVGVLAGRSIARGIAACGLGIVVGAIGASPATGEFRMDLGVTYLQDNIPLVVVGLGAFAIPEISDLMRRGAPVASTDKLGSGWLQGIIDTFRHWGLVLRCSLIGTIIGAIPGLGGGVVDWIAYGHAVQTAKDNSQFGKGDVRGILAAESSNNSLQGGALIPTLLFGIPGSGSMAIFLGGLVLLGIEPGPSLVTTQLHLTYTIAWTLMLASIIGAVLCFLLSAPISRLTFVPFNLIAPALIATLCFAAFQNRQSFGDIAALFLMGLLGVLLRRFGWPRPAFLIGFILSEQVENYFYQSLQFNGWGFLTRPGVLIIAVLSVLSLLAALRGRVSELGTVAVGTKASAAESGSAPAFATSYNRGPQVAFTAVITAALAFAIYACRNLSFLAGVYPISAAIVTLLFALYLLARQATGPLGHATLQDQEQEGEYAGDRTVASVWPQVGWFALLFALTGMFGFFIAITLYTPVFLLARTSLGVTRSLLYTACVVGFMLGMGYMLVLDFPPGLLQRFIELPWPLR
jgi:TctA family transporter